MNPQVKSLLTQMLMFVLGGAVSWLVSKGIVTADQAPQIIELLVGVAFTGGAALVAWLKSLDHSPEKLAVAAAGTATNPVPGVTVTVDAAVASPALVAAAEDKNNNVKIK